MRKSTCNTHFRHLALGLLTLACLSAGAPAIAQQVADKILVSQNVIPLASRMPRAAEPKAIAIIGERIAWIGSPQDMAAWRGVGTEVVDLGEQAVLPGFVDAHGHISFAALATTVANVASPPVGPVETMEDLKQTLREYISSRDIEPGEWVIGMGYDDSLIAENRHPNRDDLDAVSSDHPIALIHVSGHLAATNSKGLARSGINAETPDPSGGVIRRRPGSKEPDGVLEETATYAIRKHMSSANTDPLASLTAALLEYASYGITTAQDGAASPEVMTLLNAAAEAQSLLMDVIAYPVGMPTPSEVLDKYTFGEYNNRLKVGGIKLILDGSPQGKTAYLSKPYHVPPPGLPKDYAGYPTIDGEQTNALVKTYLDLQVPILAHANGDAAAQMLIDAVAAAEPKNDHRTVMIHAQTVREDQLTQMKSLEIIPSYFSAHTFYWGDWHRDSVLGETRGKRISPTASTQQRGMVFTVHNDAPIVPADMIRLLWATTNRKTRSGQTLGEAQRISTYEALRAMTVYGAYQNFEETSKGTLEVGKLADIVVLSADPLSVPVESLLDLEVRATYARGQQIYGASQSFTAK